MPDQGEQTAPDARPTVERGDLHLPADALVLLIGPAGCGKSTFARRRFRETEIVSSDECRRLVSDDAAHQWATRPAFEVFHAIVQGRLSLARLTVADATNLRAATRRHLGSIASKAGRPRVALVFDLPLDVCLQRARARDRQVDPEIITRHHDHLQEVKPVLGREGYASILLVDETGRVRPFGEATRSEGTT